MFNLIAWWRARRKPIPPGNLTDMITKLDPKEVPLLLDKPISLHQYALSQLNRNERNKLNGKGK